MRRIGVARAETAGQAPMPSSTRRLPLESAVVRASKLGCSSASGATGSMTPTSSGSFASAAASDSPTMPPPAMATSQASRCALKQPP
jgi:hypothetical protein